MITYDLNLFRSEWNRHSIRKQKFANIISGKLNYIFYQPQEHGGRGCGFDVPEDQIDRAISTYPQTPVYCNKDFIDMMNLMIPDLEHPITTAGARQQYHAIVDALDCEPEDSKNL